MHYQPRITLKRVNWIYLTTILMVRHGGELMCLIIVLANSANFCHNAFTVSSTQWSKFVGVNVILVHFWRPSDDFFHGWYTITLNLTNQLPQCWPSHRPYMDATTPWLRLYTSLLFYCQIIVKYVCYHKLRHTSHIDP